MKYTLQYSIKSGAKKEIGMNPRTRTKILRNYIFNHIHTVAQNQTHLMQSSFCSIKYSL